MCCTRLAGNAGPENDAKNRHLRTIAQLCRTISSQRHVSTIGKKLLSSNIFSTCPCNMVNFGPLAAEIVLLVWGTLANFSGFRILAALLHGTLLVGVSQTAALNRGRHLYSAGRPSRWALAHILYVYHCDTSSVDVCGWFITMSINTHCSPKRRTHSILSIFLLLGFILCVCDGRSKSEQGG